MQHSHLILPPFHSCSIFPVISFVERKQSLQLYQNISSRGGIHFVMQFSVVAVKDASTQHFPSLVLAGQAHICMVACVRVHGGCIHFQWGKRENWYNFLAFCVVCQVVISRILLHQIFAIAQVCDSNQIECSPKSNVGYPDFYHTVWAWVDELLYMT